MEHGGTVWRRGVGCVLLTAGLSACGPVVRTTMLGPLFPPQAVDAPVQTFSAKVPECPFEELALVTGLRRGGAGSEEVLEAMKERVRLMGGHAMVGLQELHKTESHGSGYTATAIHFTEPECRR